MGRRKLISSDRSRGQTGWPSTWILSRRQRGLANQTWVCHIRDQLQPCSYPICKMEQLVVVPPLVGGSKTLVTSPGGERHRNVCSNQCKSRLELRVSWLLVQCLSGQGRLFWQRTSSTAHGAGHPWGRHCHLPHRLGEPKIQAKNSF